MKPVRPDPGATLFHDATDAAPPQTPFVALVSGATAPLLALDLPPALRGQARERVAGRQISDTLGLAAEDIELRPFAARPHATPWNHVIATATDQVAAWRSRFAGAGERCQAILPDYLALPAADQVWTLACDATGVRARLGLSDGFSAETDLAVALLAKAAPPEAVLRLGEASAPVDALLAGLDLPVCREPSEIAALNLGPVEAFAHDELSFDLSRDPRAAYDTLLATLLPWRLPVLLGFLALVLWSVGTGLALRDLNEQTRQIRADTVAEVRTAFVPTGPILDLRSQVGQALASRRAGLETGGGQTAPLDLFRRAAGIIADHPATLNSAGFASGAGLSVALLLPDFAALDQLVGALEAADIAVRITESRAADSQGVSAILMLEAKG